MIRVSFTYRKLTNETLEKTTREKDLKRAYEVEIKVVETE